MKSKKNKSIAKTPSEYLKEPYARVLIPDENGTYAAEIMEFPGCFAQGDSPAEAMKNLEEAAKCWIKAALSQKQKIPEPRIKEKALKFKKSKSTKKIMHGGDQLPSYHWKDGLFFGRTLEGDVIIEKRESDNCMAGLVFRCVIPMSRWLDIVQAVSAAPDDPSTYSELQNIHEFGHAGGP